MELSAVYILYIQVIKIKVRIVNYHICCVLRTCFNPADFNWFRSHTEIRLNNVKLKNWYCTYNAVINKCHEALLSLAIIILVS